MSALALVPGRICGEPTTRPTKNGGQVTVVKRNVTNGSEVRIPEYYHLLGHPRRERECPVAEAARESALLASLALQHGCALDTLRHALAGRDVGPLAAALMRVKEVGT